MSEKRCFFFAAIYTFGSSTLHRNYGRRQETFPTNGDLRSVVLDYEPKATNVVILSICELSFDDYKTYWKDELNILDDEQR